MILLDTTCLVYAVGDDLDRRRSCTRLIEAAHRGEIVARTTSQVIVEFAHVRARRRGRADAAALARDFSDLLGPRESSTAVDTMRALDIWQRHPSAGTFDALLLAVAMRTGAEAVVSDDAGLAAIPGVPVMTAAEAVDRFVPAGG